MAEVVRCRSAWKEKLQYLGPGQAVSRWPSLHHRSWDLLSWVHILVDRAVDKAGKHTDMEAYLDNQAFHAPRPKAPSMRPQDHEQYTET